MWIAAAPPIRLYMFPGSNAVLTVQLMLAHKRLAHRRVTLPPGVHVPVLRALGFPGRTVPALEVGGRLVQGSRAIARVLDELRPDPPLFPADPRQREAVEAAERWGEELQDASRRVFYCVARRDAEGFRQIILDGQPRLSRALLRRTAPGVVRLASWAHGATDDAGRADVAALPGRVAQVDAWIEAGLLGGPQLHAADFQIAVNLAALLLSADAAPFVRGRPAEALAHRVAPGYTGPIGMPRSPGAIPAALPRDWLAAAHAVVERDG